MTTDIIIAVPKGRILSELVPLLKKINIIPEESFFSESTRQLQFKSNIPNISFIKVRSFDIATLVNYGAAHIGIAGKDVLMEFDTPDIYAPLDLNIGKCRLSIAEPKDLAKNDSPTNWSHIRVATKYPNITKKYFAEKGIQAECIKLNGAMELAPNLGLCQRIVDLVSTGQTLKENGLVEVEKITEISSLLITNRTSYKTKQPQIINIIELFSEAING